MILCDRNLLDFPYAYICIVHVSFLWFTTRNSFHFLIWPNELLVHWFLNTICARHITPCVCDPLPAFYIGLCCYSLLIYFPPFYFSNVYIKRYHQTDAVGLVSFIHTCYLRKVYLQSNTWEWKYTSWNEGSAIQIVTTLLLFSIFLI